MRKFEVLVLFPAKQIVYNSHMYIETDIPIEAVLYLVKNQFFAI